MRKKVNLSSNKLSTAITTIFIISIITSIFAIKMISSSPDITDTPEWQAKHNKDNNSPINNSSTGNNNSGDSNPYDFEYEIVNSNVTITKFTGSSGTFSIPRYCENKLVTKIGYEAFYNCTNLRIITIPDSVTSIEDYAFKGCTGLTSVTIGNSVTSIGSSAFEDCFKLVEVYNKSSLNITKGSSNNGDVGYYAKDIYTEPFESKLSTDENGFIIYTDNDVVSLIGYTGAETNLVLPDSITEINQGAFFYCTGLTSVTIPDSVTSIGEQAFYGCTGLTSVTIPNSVTSIRSYAFYGCKNLTSVTFRNTSNWKIDGTNITVTNPKQNAIYLHSTYPGKNWNRG